MTIAAAEPVRADRRDRAADRRLVRAWLFAVSALIVAMIVLGGATRLTESGLSITEWKPIHGVVPPLSAAEWEEEFAKYREIPEYQLVNRGMSLAEFKTIFWWEWSHRLLGRVIGLAVLVPLVLLWATGRIERHLVPRIGLLLALGGAQGALGWWMVASGLAVRTDVSQYRLAAHLLLGCLCLAYALWLAGGLAARPAAPPSPRRVRATAALLLGLTLLQIYLGGLVAGLDAGLTYNTWPLMDGRLVPAGLAAGDAPFWRNLFENVTLVQFNHRIVAYLILVAAILHLATTAQGGRGTPSFGRAAALLGLILLQAALGISTLLHAVPLGLALLHQFGAVVVLSALVLHLRAMLPPIPVADRGGEAAG